MCNIAERPLGLPKGLTFDTYAQDPICKLSLYNYKVTASIGSSANAQTNLLWVFDTGTGPNLIILDVLSRQNIPRIDTSRQIANLTSASQHSLDCVGVIHLYVNVSNYVVKQPFIVVKQLSTDAILGTTFIDEHVDAIWVRRRIAVLTDGTILPIEKRHSPNTIRKPNETMRVETIQDKSHNIHVAQRCILQPHSEAVIAVRTPASGIFLLESSNKLYNKRMISIANGIHSVAKNKK